MKAKKKASSKDISNQKRRRRTLLSFYRVVRYGIDSFLRNSWLSVAATAVMTITLLIVFATVLSQSILNDTLSDLRNKVDMSIYLKTDTTDQQGSGLLAEVKKLSTVRSASYISAEDARQQIIENNKNDADVLEAIKEATNKTPATIRVVLNDINDTSQLENFVNTNKDTQDRLDSNHKPSFAGERRSTIQSIGRAVQFAQKVGIVAGVIFVIISSLIIFNTIRMAIFNRKEEIQMMKLIGADRSFIRGPFLIESIIYGFVASIVAYLLGIWGLYSIAHTLASYQIVVQPTIQLITLYAVFVLIGMIIVGSVIGVVSSLFATHRHLKI